MNWADYLELKRDGLLSKGEVFLQVKVKPEASKNEITGMMDDDETMVINVEGEPRNGKANRDLIYLLAEQFHVFPEQVVIKSGQSSRHKLIQIVRN